MSLWAIKTASYYFLTKYSYIVKISSLISNIKFIEYVLNKQILISIYFIFILDLQIFFHSIKVPLRPVSTPLTHPYSLYFLRPDPSAIVSFDQLSSVLSFDSKQIFWLVIHIISFDNLNFGTFPHMFFQPVKIFLHASGHERVICFSCRL